MKGKGLKKKRGGGRGGRKESFYFKGTTTVKTKRERNWYYVRFLSPQSPGRQTGVRYSTSHGSHSASWACGAEHGAACGPATADPASIVQQLVNPLNSLILQSTQGTFATNTWKQPPWTSPVPVVTAPAPPDPAPPKHHQSYEIQGLRTEGFFLATISFLFLWCFPARWALASICG